MNLWLVVIAIGVLTYAIRLSFILALDRLAVPPLAQRALRLVPPAVLSALIFPDLLIHDGTVDLSIGNARLVAGVIAALVAWRTHNVFLTVGLGIYTLRRIVVPIRSLEASVKAIAGGDCAQSVPFTKATDEIGGLARSVEVLKKMDKHHQSRAVARASVFKHLLVTG